MVQEPREWPRKWRAKRVQDKRLKGLAAQREAGIETKESTSSFRGCTRPRGLRAGYGAGEEAEGSGSPERAV